MWSSRVICSASSIAERDSKHSAFGQSAYTHTHIQRQRHKNKWPQTEVRYKYLIKRQAVINMVYDIWQSLGSITVSTESIYPFCPELRTLWMTDAFHNLQTQYVYLFVISRDNRSNLGNCQCLWFFLSSCATGGDNCESISQKFVILCNYMNKAIKLGIAKQDI